MRNQATQPLSIIIPTLNEVDNIERLIKRIHFSLSKHGTTYEIICIDDHSTDETVATIINLSKEYPNVMVIQKQGKAGKAYSLLEGFKEAKHNLVCMIDADLQYPPEAIVPMNTLLVEQHVDIVISERIESKTSILRKLQSQLFSLLFTRLLFGINYDSQSGLKLFKKDILNNISLSPSPWSFDLEFLVRSLEKQYKIASHKILFSERTKGVSKVSTLGTSLELAKASILLRFSSSYSAVKSGYQKSKKAALDFSRQDKPFGAKKRASGAFLPAFLIGLLLTSFSFTESAHALSLTDVTTGLTNTVTDILNPVVPQAPQNPTPPKQNPVQLPTPQLPTVPILNPSPQPNQTVHPPTTTPSPETPSGQQTSQTGATSLGSELQPNSAVSETLATSSSYKTTQVRPMDPYVEKRTNVDPAFVKAAIAGLVIGSVLLVMGLNATRIRSMIKQPFASSRSMRKGA